jgi:acyl-CoA synthetase (AMP-forming)/AMP-acid ligase II
VNATTLDSNSPVQTSTGSTAAQGQALPNLDERSEAQLGDYGGVLRWRARVQPERVAYVALSNGEEETASYNYAQFDHRVRRVAAVLQAAGAAGQRVLLVLPSDLDFTMAFWACLYAGATAVTTIVPTTRAQMGRLHDVACDAGARLVISTVSIRDRIAAGLQLDEATAWVCLDALPDGDASDWVAPKVGWEDLALLQYTSGSTSRPRGVMVTHRNLLRLGQYQEKIFRLTPSDRVVTWLPQSHDFGLMFGVLQPCFTGYSAVVMSPMAFLKRPMRWLRALQQYGGTMMLAPNFAFELCAEAYRETGGESLDMSRVSLVVNGAEPIRRATYERFVSVFEPCGFRARALTSAYGLAETTLGVSGTPRTELYRYLRGDRGAFAEGRFEPAAPEASAIEVMSCGCFGSELDLRIVDPVTRRPLAPLAIGEIWIQGPIVARGYWKNEEATGELFGARLADGTGPFLRTGDLGFLCDRNELFITGRCKDILIVNGKNHAPQDIELTLELSDPAVRPHQGAVFSIERDGREVVIAAVELKREFQANADLEALGRTLVRRVALEHQIPLAEVVFMERGGCPKTTSGKVQRQRAKALYLASELETFGRYLNPVFSDSPVA